MEDLLNNLSLTDRIVLKTWSDYNNETNIDYSKHVNQKIGLLLELINSLHDDNIQMNEWKVWVEPLLFKMTFHAGSFLKLFSGTPLNYKSGELIVFDEPTALIMFRVIIENYLTFYYLYCDSISEHEKEFRFNVWKYSGLKQRSSFKVTKESSRLKLLSEQKEIEVLEKLITSSDFFKFYSKGGQKEILKGVKPRLMNSWAALNSLSGFHVDLFKNLYGFKSNYTHSEFISVMQIKSLNYGFNPNAKEHYTLMLVHSLISKCIIDLTKLFPSIKSLYDKQDFSLLKEVEFLNRLATASNAK